MDFGKNQIKFTLDELNECFRKILKSGNLEFVEWFCSLSDIIDWNNNLIKEIVFEVLEYTNLKEILWLLNSFLNIICVIIIQCYYLTTSE